MSYLSPTGSPFVSKLGASPIGGLPAQIQAQLDAAAAKFEGYANHVKLVLLDFYCNELWEDDVPPMMKRIVIPDVIDEVWRTIRDWISADDYQVGYDRLFRRLRQLSFTSVPT